MAPFLFIPDLQSFLPILEDGKGLHPSLYFDYQHLTTLALRLNYPIRFFIGYWIKNGSVFPYGSFFLYTLENQIFFML
jgi:hypothetical protein